jgi:hypothetical protein
MRTLLVLLLVACNKDQPAQVDAAIRVDAKLVDAPPDAPADARPDAPPDAPNMNVVTACTNNCIALAACFMVPADPTCNTECETDLADCTAEQVATIDACSSQPCGADPENGDSPLIQCLTAVPCIDMGGRGMLTSLRK